MKISESNIHPAVVLSIPTILLTAGSVFLLYRQVPTLAEEPDYLLFLVYLSFYIAMWGIYFASKSGPMFLRISTLRRLLLLESKHWTEQDNQENSDIEELSMEKAKTSITAIAMLVGVSFLGIIQGKTGLTALYSVCGASPSESCHWNEIIFWSLTLFSSLALVCFVLSVDALDCMFNEFKNSQAENKYRRYFYKSTIHPRYVGLVSLLTSIIFLNASINVILGSMTIGIIISIGYKHWFPSSGLTADDWLETSGAPAFWMRFTPLVLLPLLIGILW